MVDCVQITKKTRFMWLLTFRVSILGSITKIPYKNVQYIELGYVVH